VEIHLGRRWNCALSLPLCFYLIERGKRREKFGLRKVRSYQLPPKMFTFRLLRSIPVLDHDTLRSIEIAVSYGHKYLNPFY
jgi:hypothetical protein